MERRKLELIDWIRKKKDLFETKPEDANDPTLTSREGSDRFTPLRIHMRLSRSFIFKLM